MLSTLPTYLKNKLKSYTFEEVSVGCSAADVYRFFNKKETLFLKVGKAGSLETEYDNLEYLQRKLTVPEVIYYCYGLENGKEYLLTKSLSGEMACSPDNLEKPNQTVKLLAKAIKIFQGVDVNDNNKEYQNVDISNCNSNILTKKKIKNTKDLQSRKVNNSICNCNLNDYHPPKLTIDDRLKLGKFNIDNDLLIPFEPIERFGKTFSSYNEIYEFLLKNNPILNNNIFNMIDNFNHKKKAIYTENFVLSHGDFSLPNVFFDNSKLGGFLDLGELSISDFWYDIAICIKSIRFNFINFAPNFNKDVEELVDLFLKELGLNFSPIIDYYELMYKLTV
jgi:aminoglycoside phosphotransferase